MFLKKGIIVQLYEKIQKIDKINLILQYFKQAGNGHINHNLYLKAIKFISV